MTGRTFRPDGVIRFILIILLLIQSILTSADICTSIKANLSNSEFSDQLNLPLIENIGISTNTKNENLDCNYCFCCPHIIFISGILQSITEISQTISSDFNPIRLDITYAPFFRPPKY